MNEFLDPSGDQLSSEEKDIDRALRPESFDDFRNKRSFSKSPIRNFFDRGGL